MPGVILLTFFIMCAALGSQESQDETCKFLSPQEYYIKMHSSVVPLIIDTRIWKDYRRDRIPGARLAESVAVLESIVDSFDLEQEIFLYCSDYQRSSVACSILVAKGYINVYNIEGGMIAWKLEGYELDTRRIRRRKK
jgi:rhodanese-related sulfurtransferase